MAYRFNPFTGTFESGLTFPDLATPPANTALGAFEAPFSYAQIGAANSDLDPILQTYLGGTGAVQINNIDDAHPIALTVYSQAGDFNIYAVHLDLDGSGGAIEGELIAGADNVESRVFQVNNMTANGFTGFDATAFLIKTPAIYDDPPPTFANVRGVYIQDWSMLLTAGVNHPFDYNGVFFVDSLGAVTATNFIWSGTKAANLLLAGPVSGVAAAPTFRALVAADVPAINLAGSGAGGVTGNLGVSHLNSGTSASSSTFWRGDGTWAAAGAGTVTSVALSVPSILSISGSPITSSGTLAISYSGTALPVTNGGTAATSASITAFNNITGYSATGATGTTSTNLVFSTSPTFITPTLGAATATSLNGNIFTTGTYTLTGVAGKTLTFNKSLTLDGTDSTTMTFPTTSATIARTDAVNAFLTTGTNTFAGSITIGNGTSGSVFQIGSTASIQMYQGNPVYISLVPAGQLGFAAGTPGSPDSFFTRGGASASIQMGADVNGAAVAQTFQSCRGITGTDKTGAPFHFVAGSGTGAATVSYIDFTTPTVTTTGTTQQTGVVRATISSAGLNATVPIAFGGNLAISNAVPTISSGFGSGATIAGIAGGFRITCGTAPGVGGTVAFNTTYANAPVCFVQDETTGILGIAAPTTTTVVISGLTLLSGQTVAVFVFGY